MSTTFRFSPQQIIELTQLRDQAATAGDYVAVYQRILDILNTPTNYIGLPPKPITPRDNAAVGQDYNWFAGAIQVNKGSGPFATLIIQYTQHQAEQA